jgi:hypothetical protein
VVRSSRLLAGLLKSEDSLSDRLRKIDKSELAFVKEVVFTALVDAVILIEASPKTGLVEIYHPK